MITRVYEVTIRQTRTAVVKVRLLIEAVDERSADAARDDIYDLIHKMRSIGRELRFITASEVHAPDAEAADGHSPAKG